MKLKLNAAVFVVVVISAALAIWGYKSVQFKQDAKVPDNCSKCHEMKLEYYTWKASAHDRLACIECHQDVKLAVFRYKHQVGFSQPVKLKKIIPNQVCLDCHSKNRKLTPPGDLIIPHELHLKKGVDCVDCHSNVAHGDPAKRFSTLWKERAGTGINFETELIKDLVKAGNGVPMSTCIRCHNGTKATKDCKACHTVLRIPE